MKPLQTVQPAAPTVESEALSDAAAWRVFVDNDYIPPRLRLSIGVQTFGITFDYADEEPGRLEWHMRMLQSALERLTTAHGIHPANGVDEKSCRCEACVPQGDFMHPENMRMIVCALCGYKRCPHATDHRNPCSNSNDVGQKGSSWEHVKPFPGDPKGNA